MADKNKNKASVVKITAEAAVNNSINLTLNQNDLVELVIQEKLFELDKSVKDVRSRMKATDSEIEKIEKELCSSIYKKYLPSKYVEQIKKIQDALNIDIPVRVSVYNNNREVIGTYYSIGNGREVSSLPNKGYFERMSTESSWFSVEPASINVTIETDIEDSIVSLYHSDSYRLSKSDTAIFKKKLEKLNLAAYNLKVSLYELQKQQVEYLFNEKKIKAAIVKQQLGTTVQGKEVLALLDRARGATLLGQ